MLRLSLSCVFTRGLKKKRVVEAILLKPLANLGEAKSIVRVKPGYMRHSLYPLGMAVYATDENIVRYIASSNFDKTKAPPSRYQEEVKKSHKEIKMQQSTNHVEAPTPIPVTL